jgi:hypothetical protein
VSPAIALAVGMTRSWVALYTLGLPRALRDGRRAEIDCDLWEQRELAEYTGEPPLGTATEIAARTVLGMLSDITWRAQAGLSAHSDRSLKMNEPSYIRGLVAAGVVVALFLVVTGIGSVVDALVQGDLASGQAAFGAISVLAGAAVAAGLLTSKRNPLLGIGLVAAGAITVAAAWYWMLPITIPVGIVLVAIAYFRARPALRRPEPGPA